MKKILSLFLLFTAVIGLAACKPVDDPDVEPDVNLDLEAVEAAIADVTLGDLSEVLTDFTLPTAHEDGATYTWFSSDGNTIAIDGTSAAVTRPGEGEDDATVTLTVTAAKGIENETKTFTATVIAVPGGVAEKLAEAKKSLRFVEVLDLANVVETSFLLPLVSPLYEEIVIDWTVVAYDDMSDEFPTEPTKPAGYVSVGEAGRVAYAEATSGYDGCMIITTDDLSGDSETGTRGDMHEDLFTHPVSGAIVFPDGVAEAACGWWAYDDNGAGGTTFLMANGVWDMYPSYVGDTVPGDGDGYDETAVLAMEAYDQFEIDNVYFANYDTSVVTTSVTANGLLITIVRPADANVNVRMTADLSWNDEDVVVDPVEKDFELVVVQAPQDDETRVAEAQAALQVFGIDFVDGDFDLPLAGLYDSAITWGSSNTGIIIVDAMGHVTVAAPLKNTAVTLTATLVVGTEELTKSFVAVVVGSEATYTYRTTISDTTNINPHNTTLANASTLFGWITGGLYNGDFDWETSIADGVATSVGDFTNSASLSYDRFPYMAADMPIDVSVANGEELMTVWEIPIRDDVYWEDGTLIDAFTYEYSYRMLLDPRLLNERASNLYTDIPVLGANAYATQSTPANPLDAYTTTWDTVGIEATSQFVLQITLSAPMTDWDLRGSLQGGANGPVHEGLYEAGMNETRTVTSYGTAIDNIMSYGPYNLTTWEPGVVYIYERNDDHFDAESFRMTHIRYNTITDQSIIVNEFKADRLDVAGVGGVYYPEFKNNPNVQLSPATTTFRWATNIGERTDGNTNPMMKYADFRNAIYHAIDRQEMVATVNAPAFANQAFLSPEYIISDTSTQSYRGSAQGVSVLAGLYPDTAGYNPVAALALFNSAYAQAVSDGVIDDGDLVWLELTMFDAETNWTTNNWVSNVVTNAFDAQLGGANEDIFEFRINALGGDALDVAVDNHDFDIVFYGWQGMKFDPIGLIGYVYNSHYSYMQEWGWDSENWEIPVAIPNFADQMGTLVDPADVTEPTAPTEVTEPTGYIAVAADGRTAWYDALDAAGKTAADAYDVYLVDYAAYAVLLGTYNTWVDDEWLYDKLMTIGTDDVLMLTFNEWMREHNPGGFLYTPYDGRDEDYLNIMAGIEARLLDEVLAIPLFSRVGTVVYSDRVVVEVQEYHAWMGWGGMKYMYLNSPDPIN